MSIFAWKNEYAVGYTEIDDQHKQLFAMADDLHRGMLERRGKEALAGLLQQLITYTRHHFACEEKVMRESGYPRYPQHHMEHEKLTRQVLEFQKKVIAGQATVTIELMNFLSEWLRHHIAGSDVKVAEHVKSRSRTLASK